MFARKLNATTLVMVALVGAAHAQVPDLLNSFDPGGRGMGVGGGIAAAGSDTQSTLNNPAGLAHVTQRSVSVTLRNKPQSRTTATSTFRNPVLDTKGEVGPIGIAHIGYVMPVGSPEAPRGGIGISYTTVGYVRDQRVGNGGLILDATSSVTDYQELLKGQTDMFAVGYGWGNGDKSLTFGASLLLASHYTLNRQTYSISTGGGQPIPNPPLDLSGTGTGIGGVVGVQLIPRSNPNLSFGASVRTPINLSGNGTTAAYYDDIPGKISLGVAYRKDGYRGGQDYAVFGLQADAFFKNERGQAFSRKRAVSVGGGVEYNMLRGNARIPVRLGFQAVPAAGAGFKERNAFTFGVGYRPFNRPFSLDLNFASPSGGGGFDTALHLNFKVK